MNSNLKKVQTVIFICFLAIILALGYWQILKGSSLRLHPRNRYEAAIQDSIVRGGIYDRNKLPLAINDDGGNRLYPIGAPASNLIGYHSKTLGGAGVELWFNQLLSGQGGFLGLSNSWQRLAGTSGKGYNLQLTIDAELQKLGYNLLGGRKGAVVAIDPSNGELLSVISSPGYEMEDLEANWSNYTGDTNKPLFNRALSGAYPPGSTFKLVVGAAALDLNLNYQQKEFYCPGYVEVDGRYLSCSKEHGKIDLIEGLALSCNVVFAELGLALGGELLREMAQSFGHFDSPGEGFPAKYFSLGTPPFSKNALAETAIGQGQVLASPLQMALVAATIGNNGVWVEPILLKAAGSIREEFEPLAKVPIKRQIMRTDTAQILKEGMLAAVEWGTGWPVKLSGVKVAGKTGSAENPHGRAHAWFVAFAPVDKPQIAIAVIVENAGTGGGQAAPIAREMIKFHLGLR
ncbi:MAG: penicillin-binding transpeptidase domain-containing protein [Bacillota bacterium]